MCSSPLPPASPSSFSPLLPSFTGMSQGDFLTVSLFLKKVISCTGRSPFNETFSVWLIGIFFKLVLNMGASLYKSPYRHFWNIKHLILCFFLLLRQFTNASSPPLLKTGSQARLLENQVVSWSLMMTLVMLFKTGYWTRGGVPCPGDVTCASQSKSLLMKLQKSD